ncbi:MAG: AAA family ATPase [Candidatus Methanomethylicia archaeon]|nr:AAA family ATPase [Candidatus Methanomethylicia archaeon]
MINTLIAICGLPGTGKSTVADILSKKIKAPVLRTDEIRKKIIEKPTYSEEEKKLVYKVMFIIAEYLIKQGISCILDATFNKEENRKEIVKLAERNNVPLYFIECVCNEEVIRERLRGDKRFSSDANWEVYLKLKSEFEPIKEDHIVVDTTKGSKEAADILIEKLKLLGIIKS